MEGGGQQPRGYAHDGGCGAGHSGSGVVGRDWRWVMDGGRHRTDTHPAIVDLCRGGQPAGTYPHLAVVNLVAGAALGPEEVNES